MDQEWVAILLLGVAGFLVGGVYSTWRNDSRGLAVGFGIAALVAIGGAVAWLM
ncbi:hypothetical protein [Prauserella rugosa]|uniref:Uncharacterized protein n=1 Tax=Prauserella rugosa TaxID=43354 RepID=A0A660CCR7_9PSEU|nr:hypothetical protein [Prauserella rugosa]KID30512.1 hypothetical protein HQ32_02013 [Prauserella sp. Am3]TWH20194.1 hypothetical protein JD82_02036 [Prauserella rugosa]